MKHRQQILLLILLLNLLSSCKGQSASNADPVQSNSQIVGGGCDGCELMYVGMPAAINSVDTSAGWKEEGQKLLVKGKVYQQDGKTPAPDVIIYYWQTDSKGYYSPVANMDEKAKRHGHIRGWVKSDENGSYAIYTIRPAPYPDQKIPAHIHLSIKEPGIPNEYYPDDLMFDDDTLFIGQWRKNMEYRGGSGVLRVLMDDGLQVAEHNVYLGLNIPNYPRKSKSETKSGREVGEDSPSFSPFHAWGPDKGTTTCPICKYGRFHGIIYFVGNKPDWKQIKDWLIFLESESVSRSKYLKAYFVYGNENNYSRSQRQKELEEVGRELGLKHLALTFVPSFSDKETEVYLNKISPTVENTFIIYRHGYIIDKFVNLYPSKENFTLISTTLDKTRNEFFDLEVPHRD